MAIDREVLDWDDLSRPDQIKAEELMRELNELFNKYTRKEDEPCEDSTSTE